MSSNNIVPFDEIDMDESHQQVIDWRDDCGEDIPDERDPSEFDIPLDLITPEPAKQSYFVSDEDYTTRGYRI